MSTFTFAQEIVTFGYLYKEQVEYLCVQHNISSEQAKGVIKRLGFEEIQYGKENEDDEK